MAIPIRIGQKFSWKRKTSNINNIIMLKTPYKTTKKRILLFNRLVFVNLSCWPSSRIGKKKKIKADMPHLKTIVQ